MGSSLFWMLLNAALAKMSFDQGANWAGWFCLFFSAWYLARVMTMIF